MTMQPWTQQAALPPGAPQKAPKKEPFRFTMPWQEEHWADQPAWTRTVGKAGLGIGLGATGILGGMAVAPALAGASAFAPWLTGPALAAMAHPTALGALGGFGGLMTSAYMAPGRAGEPPTVPTVPWAGQPPTAPTTPPGPGVLPTPGEGAEPTGPVGQPQVITVGDQQFWWNPTGGLIGSGGWDLISPRAERLTPEQEMAQAEAQRAHQMEMLRLQYELEQQAMGGQATQVREQQAAAAAQQMAQMYAADPYKYWAQMGQGTPEAVARLTGGRVAPGEEFERGVPLSTPSAQWWGGLLPSEQQQIMGGVNWMGVDPKDYYSMYQRMIPGLGQRQMAPTWAR